MTATDIEWTKTLGHDGKWRIGYTFNAWWGCEKISPGCARCYAANIATSNRLNIWGQHVPRLFQPEAYWDHPEHWNATAERQGVRRKVFSASMSDVFERLKDDHPQVLKMSAERRRLFELTERTAWLDWLLVTKRPQNIMGCVPARWQAMIPPNVWIITTTENQQEADARIPHLQRAPAAIRGLSVEPMLGPVKPDLSGIHWVICGGESGEGARPMDLNWARALRDQCAEARVPFFLKQLGGHPNKRGGEDAVLDGRTHVEFPTALESPVQVSLF